MERTVSVLAEVFTQSRDELLRFLCARCGNPQDAEDLLQDLWLKLDGLSTGPMANPRAYLFRMANNLVLDRKRSHMRAMRRDRQWLGEDAGSGEIRPDPAQAADEALADAQEAEILRRAVAELPPGARQALQLYRFEERGQAEISQIMGISRSGVEKHLALAMKHLRNALNNCGAFAPVTSEGMTEARISSGNEGQGE